MKLDLEEETSPPELDTSLLKKQVEALVFAAETPITEKRVAECIRTDGVDHKIVLNLIEELNEDYYQAGRAFHIVRLAGGFQYVTMPDVADCVARLFENKKDRKLTRAAMETLSIIAYKQPITRSEIESIRGVNADWLVRSLMEKRLITVTGRSDAAGKPLTYGTTPLFLETFGLGGLEDLPKLKEIEELLEEDELKDDQIEVEFDLTSAAREKNEPPGGVEAAVSDDLEKDETEDDEAGDDDVEDLDTALNTFDSVEDVTDIPEPADEENEGGREGLEFSDDMPSDDENPDDTR